MNHWNIFHQRRQSCEIFPMMCQDSLNMFKLERVWIKYYLNNVSIYAEKNFQHECVIKIVILNTCWIEGAIEYFMRHSFLTSQPCLVSHWSSKWGVHLVKQGHSWKVSIESGAFWLGNSMAHVWVIRKLFLVCQEFFQCGYVEVVSCESIIWFFFLLNLSYDFKKLGHKH